MTTVAADSISIATGTATSGTSFPLVLDGAAVSGGVASFAAPVHVTFLITIFDAGGGGQMGTFTIHGTLDGNTITEDVTFTNTNVSGQTYQSTGVFDTVTGIDFSFPSGPPDASWKAGNSDSIVTSVDYNCECDDTTLNETLAQLRRRILIGLGYSAQASTPPPGMADLIDEWLRSSQRALYIKWKPLRTERFYTWTMVEGTRFYDVMDNQETCTKRLDAYRVTWVGVKDLNGRFYPLRKGIDPSRYTWLSKNGFPDSYEIRECIEVFPPPAGAYTLVVKGHFGLEALDVDADKTTIDSELVFLWALGRAKAHYGHPDANDVKKEARDYLSGLVGGSHGTARYIPGKAVMQAEPQPILILPEE